ncbi:hypothetical protein TNCV_3498061 [Trichonephila clavipes]|nr:hypothetical protein TNCV_3498061 [Trichonephila clavipes]
MAGVSWVRVLVAMKTLHKEGQKHALNLLWVKVLALDFRRVVAVVEWSRYRLVADLVTRSSPVPLKTRRVGQRCTLNLSRAQMSSR